MVDAADNAPLPGAMIAAVGAEQSMPVVAGPTGAFSIRVPVGPIHLTATRLGFAPDTVAVGANQAVMTFRLRATSIAIDPITVLAERSFSTASSATIREVDIRLRPQESAQELLSLVPGVVIAQHAGGGKAEQIFARGFDADHGTDVAVSVDGTPVNMVSHAHGQRCGARERAPGWIVLKCCLGTSVNANESGCGWMRASIRTNCLAGLSTESSCPLGPGCRSAFERMRSDSTCWTR